MSAALRRRKSFSIGPVHLGVSIDEGNLRKLRKHRLLTKLVRRAPAGAMPPRPAQPSSGAAPMKPEAAAIFERIQNIDWYHVIDLPHGVSTPGRADHRREIGMYGLPESMAGMRALDVATFDGFWAFAMEGRGADVTAIDVASWDELDLPLRWREGMGPGQDIATGEGFRVAAELLRSRVRRRETSVYALSPEREGLFDVVFISDLLQHLRDPQLALERVYSVVRPGGVLILAEEYSPLLERYAGQALVEFRSYEGYTWWIPSTPALKVMLEIAGFNVSEMARVGLKFDQAYRASKVILHARRAPLS